MEGKQGQKTVSSGLSAASTKQKRNSQIATTKKKASVDQPRETRLPKRN